MRSAQLRVPMRCYSCQCIPPWRHPVEGVSAVTVTPFSCSTRRQRAVHIFDTVLRQGFLCLRQPYPGMFLVSSCAGACERGRIGLCARVRVAEVDENALESLQIQTYVEKARFIATVGLVHLNHKANIRKKRYDDQIHTIRPSKGKEEGVRFDERARSIGTSSRSARVNFVLVFLFTWTIGADGISFYIFFVKSRSELSTKTHFQKG
jgi:hypothetical protein